MTLNRVGKSFSFAVIVLLAIGGTAQGHAAKTSEQPPGAERKSTEQDSSSETTENKGQKGLALVKNGKSGAQGRLQLPDPDLVRRGKNARPRRAAARTVLATNTVPRSVQSSAQTVVVPPAPAIVKREPTDIGSPFGYRSDPFTRKARFHSGVDIKAHQGTPVGASHAGTVVFAGWDHDYGNLVIVDHGGGVSTYYAHLSSFKLGVGDRVVRGTTLGYAGSTGRSTSPHLHYELRVGENPVNPLQPVALDPSSAYFTEATAPAASEKPTTSGPNLRQAGKESNVAGRDAEASGLPGNGVAAAAAPVLRPVVDHPTDPSSGGRLDANISMETASPDRRPAANASPTEESQSSQSKSETDKQPGPRVASIVTQGKPVVRTTPVYPLAARTMRLEGTVPVEVLISAEGRVESARALSGHPLLIAAAQEAARNWRFEPTLLNGVPERATGVITFIFKLNY